MSQNESGDVRTVTEHREGCAAAFVEKECDCPVTAVMLDLTQLRVLYEAANSYDVRLPAEAHRPLWVDPIERLLAEEGEH